MEKGLLMCAAQRTRVNGVKYWNNPKCKIFKLLFQRNPLFAAKSEMFSFQRETIKITPSSMQSRVLHSN